MSDPIHLKYDGARIWHALIVGRAGLDLYPEPDGVKIRDALSFTSDLGGSAGNIAVAMARAGGKVSLISGLSSDAVGDFVRSRLHQAGVDTSLIVDTRENERTSLALAEVRDQDCEVVIYRNDPADLQVICSAVVKQAIANSHNLVVTGTSLIEPHSRENTIAMMRHARETDCRVWIDLDYRSWNWPSLEATRQAYGEAAKYCDVLIGNEDEFSVLSDDIESQIIQCGHQNQVIILKRGQGGSTLYSGKACLDMGIYQVKALKPYGAGDAFLGNLLMAYLHGGDWESALDRGSAAAAIVVSSRGCASAMPKTDAVIALQTGQSMIPESNWR